MTLLNRCLRHTTIFSGKSYALTSLRTNSHARLAIHSQFATKRHYGKLWPYACNRDRIAIVLRRSSHTTTLGRETSHGREEEVSASSEGKHRNGALPFTSIPGPKPYPIIGNKFLFTHFGGYPFDTFWSTCRKLYSEYGPIVRIAKLTSKLDMVFVFQPEDTRQLFKNEGPLPIRPPMDILEHYRKSRPNWFTSSGLVPGNGPEWRRLRTGVQVLLKRGVVSHYRPKQAAVAQDFVALIQNQYPSSCPHSHQSHVIRDFLPLLFRYTLEAVGVVALGTRLGCLDTEGDHACRAHSIISANEDVLFALGESLFKAPLHRIYPTKTFLRLAHAQDVIGRLVEEQLAHHKESWSADHEKFSQQQPFLAALMDQPNINNRDVFLLLVEVFQGGIDATATTIAFCVHYLSRNEEVQSLLYQEVKNVDLTTHDLQGLRYLRAVLQETFRLRPSASANGRILPQDAVFSGYHVPAGTLVSSPPVIACHNEEVFPDPQEFQPQRWLAKHRRRGASLDDPHKVSADDQSAGTTKKIHPYALVPFGHGARMCPGRRLAEQEIFIVLIQLVKCFRIEQIDTVSGSEVGQVMRMNMMPDAPIGVRLIPRS